MKLKLPTIRWLYPDYTPFMEVVAERDKEIVALKQTIANLEHERGLLLARIRELMGSPP